MDKQDYAVFKQHHLQEECGVFGVFSTERGDLASHACCALFALQHRGQESAGIAVNDDGVFTVRRGTGLVSDVFPKEALAALGQGNMAVGHVRYATTGADSRDNAQPLLINHHKGPLALAHNGNLTNSWDLRRELEKQGSIFHTTTDSEVIAYVIVQERLNRSRMEEAVAAAMDKLEGAYSLVIASPSKLIAARDPHGFRPLCMGRRPDGSVVFASESCALDAVGAAFDRDIEPGEVVTVDAGGVRSDRSHCGQTARRLCVFEYIYFARPDSVLDGTSVCLARQRAGELLSAAHPVEADVVIGVPDSGLDAAIGYARASGIPSALGFTKNKYVGRTFIAPTQGEREAAVNVKLNPIRAVVEGKRIILIDDSIVRGTTCRHIIAPPFVAPCYYGTDIDTAENLIANRHTVEEIAHIIGADSLGYLPMEDVVRLTGRDTGFCTACFGGAYPTAVPDALRKDRFEKKIHT